MQAASHIINYRAEQCRVCKTPCQYQNDLVFRYNGDNACPIGRWMDYKLFVKRQPMRGMGDAVARVAQPIAGVIDKVFKTHVKSCGGCAKRREMLNTLMPFNSVK